MLFFWAPDISSPVGGIKQIYRHAEILERSGIPATVLHTQKGFACDWFHHEAPLAHLGESLSRRARRGLGTILPQAAPAPSLDLTSGRTVYLAEGPGRFERHTLTRDDILVLPEYLGARLAEVETDLSIVILNQGWRNTFRDYGLDEAAPRPAYLMPNVLGAIAVSDYVRDYLTYSFEDLDVHRVVVGVDSSLFHTKAAVRRRRIAYVPRRKPHDLEQLLNILRIRGALDGWELVPITGLTEAGVAEALRGSLLFLSTCSEEGFGLPPVEAGMAGCLVVGYTGLAAEEYFEPGLTEKVAQDDVLGFAKAAERLMSWALQHPGEAAERSVAFSEFLRERYSLERERATVLQAWQSLLSEHERRASANMTTSSSVSS